MYLPQGAVLDQAAKRRPAKALLASHFLNRSGSVVPRLRGAVLRAGCSRSKRRESAQASFTSFTCTIISPFKAGTALHFIYYWSTYSTPFISGCLCVATSCPNLRLSPEKWAPQDERAVPTLKMMHGNRYPSLFPPMLPIFCPSMSMPTRQDSGHRSRISCRCKWGYQCRTNHQLPSSINKCFLRSFNQ